MAKDMREEVSTLIKYRHILYESLKMSVIMPAAELIEIRNRLEICDNLDMSNQEKVIFFETVAYWRKCLDRWLQLGQDGDNTWIPDLELKTKKFPGQEIVIRRETLNKKVYPATRREKPKTYETYEERLTKEDRKFLIGFKISPAGPKSDGSDENNDDGA